MPPYCITRPQWVKCCGFSSSQCDQVETVHRNCSQKQLGIEYDTLDSVLGSNIICVVFVNYKIFISVIFLCSGQILPLTLLVEYAFLLSTTRVTGIVFGKSKWFVNGATGLKLSFPDLSIPQWGVTTCTHIYKGLLSNIVVPVSVLSTYKLWFYLCIYGTYNCFCT